MDTCALFHIMSDDVRLTEEARELISLSQQYGCLYISSISAWESEQKYRKKGNTYDFRNQEGGEWFMEAIGLLEATVTPICENIGISAAVMTELGHKDPADCMIMATARLKGYTLVTSDLTIIRLAPKLVFKAVQMRDK